MKTVSISAIVSGILAVALCGQRPLEPVDVRNVGPQVGSTVPAFVLPDQRGQTRTLASLMGPKGLVLVFFRSADW
jgi:hypothetical protein